MVAPGIFPAAVRDAHGSVGVYFEAAVVITALVLLGQVLELRARNKTGAAVRALLGLAPRTARVVTDAGKEEVEIQYIAEGDRLRIRPGRGTRRQRRGVRRLDASDADTLVLDAGNVSAWQDRRMIGTFDRFSGASAGVRPAFIANALNGRAVVEFADGDHLTSTGFDDLSGELNYTVFIVASHTGNGDQGILTITNGGNPGVRVGFTGGGSTLSFLHRFPVGVAGGTTVTLDNVTANDPHIIWARRAR